MSLVALGKAYELTYVRDGRSTEETVKIPGWWWAWTGDADNGSILLVKPVGFRSQGGSAKAKAMHAEFHGDLAGKLMNVEAPSLSDAKRAGLVVSFAYDARGFSRSKSTMPYRHHFGAETHDEKPPFPQKYWPILGITADGGICIKRRPGNSFRLADWVIG
jgi:hypothetical protein